ncbi:MAG: hypothetical protein ISS31_05500 [Kiritimatiellae bacterium]|nr:hypothetical protein [Kiritimatiellia bacterium]
MASGAHRFEAALSGWRACYGVDLQGDHCVAVRAERVRGKVVCSPVDAGAINRLAAEGLPVVSVMSERESFTRWVEAPYGSASKARKVFPTLLDIQLPFALDNCVHTFIDVERTEQGSCRGLAAAARRTHVTEKLAACDARGLDPMVLDQAGLALWTQALRELPPADLAAPRVVAWLDDTHLTLVKGQGTQFASAHTVRADDTDRIRHLVGATEPDAAPAAWVWCGPAATPERVDALWQALGGPGTRQTVDAPSAFLVRAVAARALLPGPYRCNLRCADITHADLSRRDRRRGMRTLALALSAAVLLAAADGFALWTLKTRTRDVEQGVSEQIDALAGYHVTARGRDALRTVQDAVQERKDAMAPFLTAMEPSLITQLVQLMETAGANGLYLDTVQLSKERTEVRGTSPDWNQCEVILPVLAESGAIPELKRGEALASERIPFTVMKGGAR